MKHDILGLTILILLLLCGFGIGAAVFRESTSPAAFTPEQCFTVPTGQQHTTADIVADSDGEVRGLVPKITGVEWLTRCEKSEWRAP